MLEVAMGQAAENSALLDKIRYLHRIFGFSRFCRAHQCDALTRKPRYTGDMRRNSSHLALLVKQWRWCKTIIIYNISYLYFCQLNLKQVKTSAEC